jgi:hypothetical protein
LAARADSVAFDVRPGRWEMTMTENGVPSGMPLVAIPPQVLAQLSPAQRAKKGSRYAGVEGDAKRGSRSQMMLDRRRASPRAGFRQLAQLEDLHQADRDGDRRASNLRQQGYEDPKILCGTFDFRAISREALVGSTDATFYAGPETRTIQEKISSKRLGPDCGAVKR